MSCASSWDLAPVPAPRICKTSTKRMLQNTNINASFRTRLIDPTQRGACKQLGNGDSLREFQNVAAEAAQWATNTKSGLELCCTERTWYAELQLAPGTELAQCITDSVHILLQKKQPQPKLPRQPDICTLLCNEAVTFMTGHILVQGATQHQGTDSSYW